METHELLTHDRSADPSMTYLGLGRRKVDRLSQKLSPHLTSRATAISRKSRSFSFPHEQA